MSLIFAGFSYNCCYFKIWAYIRSRDWARVSHKSGISIGLMCHIDTCVFLFLLISTSSNWHVDCWWEYVIYSVELDLSLDASSAAIHEFRIPPKALVGLHSYCPVHFDALHAVLVDVSVHASILKVATHSFPSKLPRFVNVLIFQFESARIFFWH